MLVKARFVEELQIDEIDFRFVFLLSEEDHALLGNPVFARPGSGAPVGYGGGADLIADADQVRLFVAAMTFRPDGGEAPAAPEAVTTLRPGGYYWIMLGGIVPKKPEDGEIVTPESGQLRGFRLVRMDAQGIYISPGPRDFHGIAELMAASLPEAPMEPYLGALVMLPEGTNDGLPPFPAQELIDQAFRMAGCVLGFPITRQFYEEGLRLYTGLQGQIQTPRIADLYRIWANATPRKRPEREEADPDEQADDTTLIVEPLRQTVIDLSNPTEFGAPGARLLMHFLLAPYSLVGPASSPGGVTAREGSGVMRKLPFWACDVLAQALYQVPPTPGVEPHAVRRAQAVVIEAFFHLERRNRRAFDVLKDSGYPDRDAQPLIFDFLELLSPAGSTVFSETVVDDGVVRRKNDLEKAVMPRLHHRKVWVADRMWRTPWMALAGFLGIPLRSFGLLGGRESRMSVTADVTMRAWHPAQVERAELMRHNFLQLASRGAVDREMGRLVIDQAARVNEAAELAVHPPVVETPGVVHPAHRHVLTVSQAEAFRNAQRWRLTLVTGDPGTGKAASLDTKILTPSGWKRMGDMQVGDQVIGRDGLPTDVLAIYPQGEQDIYKVTFSDGSSTECTDDHLWLTARRDRRKKTQKSREVVDGRVVRTYHPPELQYTVRSLRQIRETLVDSQGTSNHQIPLVTPPQLWTEDAERPLDPYLLGALLGNGCFRMAGSTSLSTGDTELIERLRELLPAGHQINQIQSHPSGYDYTITCPEKRGNEVLDAIRLLELHGKLSIEKFVPQQYLFARVSDRLALLQGLLDTDGYADGYQIEFASSSPRLANDVQFLVESLGGTATMSIKEAPGYSYKGEQHTGHDGYRLYIALPPEVEPFRTTRKAQRYTPRTKYLPKRIIRSVELVGRKPAQCIRVANAEGLYVTDHCIVTHNTHMMKELVRLVREATDAEGFLLVLAPTNRAAARLAQQVAGEAQTRLYLLGEETDEPGMPLDFDIAVGTIDSFRARMETVETFRDLILGRPLVMAIDEGSMVTMEQFASVVDLLSVVPEDDWAGQEGLADSVLRIVLVGDPFQLPSVEPGNFFWDMMRFLPVVRLREQKRFGREEGDRNSLEQFFTVIRLGMEQPEARATVVDWMLAHDATHKGDIQRFERWGLSAPDNRHGQVRVILLDDLPQRLPSDDVGWQEFMLQLNDQVRDAVFREITDWNSEGQRTETVPFVPHPTSNAEREAAWKKFILFREDMTKPKAPFKVVTMFRKMISDARLTHYISSADRVNGWFQDALMGTLIGPDNTRQIQALDLPSTVVIPDVRWRDQWRDLAGKQHLRDARLMAFTTRPRDLNLCPGWPYTVLRNEFRSFGVFRSETVTYVGPVIDRGRQRFRFISEQGKEMVISRRYARLRYLAYGWSTNVHQIQGAEYPLVVGLWFEGMAYRQVQAWWQDIQPSAERATEVLDLGGDGEERMDLRAFYTAITRTRATFDLTRRNKQTGERVVTPAPGRCVIIAGRHALRRYLGLQVQQRATGFAGTVLDMVRNAAQEGGL